MRGRTARNALPPDPPVDLEWIGGRILFPSVDALGADPPLLDVWLEEPSGVVIGMHMPELARNRSFAASFKSTERKPMAGPPRRPRRIRVADEDLAAEMRGAVGGRIDVRVAPTPEIDAFLQILVRVQKSEHENASYLLGGRVDPGTIAAFFDAAREIHISAPWDLLEEDQLLRLDIPAYGIHAACVAVIGAHQLGDRGMLIFPSLAEYEAYAQSQSISPRDLPKDPTRDAGASFLALDFQLPDEVAPSKRREAKEHRWRLLASGRHPVVSRWSRDGILGSIDKRDIEIVTACAGALSTFIERNAERLEEEEPVSATITNLDGLEVRFTYPFEAYDEFEDEPQPYRSRPQKIGRNEPCHCGSGKKYKNCHLDADERMARSASTLEFEAEWQPPGDRAAVHALDERLVEPWHDGRTSASGSGGRRSAGTCAIR